MAPSCILMVLGAVLIVTSALMVTWSFYVICKYKSWLGLGSEGVHTNPNLMRVFSVYNHPKNRPKRHRQERHQQVPESALEEIIIEER